MEYIIDAELLRKEIEKNKNMIDGLFTEGDDSVYDGEDDAYNRVLRIIDAIPVNDESPTETVKKYVLQRADGRFWTKKKHPTKSYFEKGLSNAYLFSTEKSAKEHLSRPEMGEMAVKIRPVMVMLPANDEPVYIPSVWAEESIKKSPSTCSWASVGDDGEYAHGEKYYDADGHEISKEEYEGLVGPTHGLK